MGNPRLSRRSLLGQGLAGLAGFTVLPRHVLGGPGFLPPSETLTHAVIGVGGMGRGHVNMVKGDRQGRLLAVCDVDANHLGRAVKMGGKGVQGYGDFRAVLDRGDIDIVHIVTPPHWHAPISVLAAESGHDIWCEKPMTRTLGEGQRVIDAVKRNGTIFRLNTWFRLYGGLYGLGWSARPLKKLAMSGALGWPLTVRVSPYTGFDWKLRLWCGRTNQTPQPVPQHFDYDLWLGPAPVKPYNAHRTHVSFRGYWDYDGGGLADMGQHYLDPVQYILDKDGTSPVEISAKAPWPVHPDAVGRWAKVEMKYADGCRIILESGEFGGQETKGKPYLEGTKGKIYRGRRTDPGGLADLIPTLPDPEPMVTNFNEAVKRRRKFGLNELNGNRSNMLVHLANAAIRTGRKLTFDPVKCRFVGDPGADLLIDQPMRTPWQF